MPITIFGAASDTRSTHSNSGLHPGVRHELIYPYSCISCRYKSWTVWGRGLHQLNNAYNYYSSNRMKVIVLGFVQYP